MSGLTPKRERFVQAYFRLGNQRKAYREAYNADKMSDNAVDREACLLLKDPKVAQRLAFLQDETAKKTSVDVELLTKMLMSAYKKATSDGQHSAAVSASMGLAKLYGLITDKVKSETTVTRETDQMTDDELAAIAAGRSPASASKAASPEESDFIH